MAGQIKGFPTVMANLNREIQGIKNHSMSGLIKFAAHIRVDMDKTPPLIPIDTGNLRASWFTSPFRSGNQFGLICGFSANYSVHVHEMVDKGKKINWNRPGSGPKFFEKALNRNKDTGLEIIRQDAMIKR